jgi:hypothetical protein
VEPKKLSSSVTGGGRATLWVRLPFLLPAVFSIAAVSGAWTDPATHLTWATTDNGFAVTYSQAQYYCSHLLPEGGSGWTVPSIDNLQTLFGGTADDRGYHVLGAIHLTGWQWSSTPGKQSGEQWALDFGDGARASVAAGDSGLNRVLCVLRVR